MPKINDFLKGFQDGLPGLKDYRHASRLYLDDNFKLAPKQKFLFHVVFNLDEDLFLEKFGPNERIELNMLVKACELPKYGMNVEERIQYNKNHPNDRSVRVQRIVSRESRHGERSDQG